ncbi:MAG: NAD(P)H-dependent oxidoreductase [Cyclobacteriaceae bacterium]
MITIISSTNRKDSNSSIIAGIYQNILQEENEESEIIRLTDMPADFISSALYEQGGKNEQFNSLRDKMMNAEKFVFIVPEYNGSFPGVLKTFIDGLKFPDTFTGKKSALVGLSSGIQGAVLAMSHMTDILNYCGTSVLSQKPKLSGIEKNLENGELTNPLYQQLIKDQIKAFIKF